MENTLLKFGASLLLTAAFSAAAMAQDKPATNPPPAEAAASAPAAGAAAGEATPAHAKKHKKHKKHKAAKSEAAPAATEAAKGTEAASPAAVKAPAKKHKKGHKHHARSSRQAELSAAMAREVTKRKGEGAYSRSDRVRDLDRDIDNMQKAVDVTRDEAHRARLQSMVDHLKGLRDFHTNRGGHL